MLANCGLPAVLCYGIEYMSIAYIHIYIGEGGGASIGEKWRKFREKKAKFSIFRQSVNLSLDVA